MPDRPETIATLDRIAERYAVILCDVWGVVHNGIGAFEAATAALARARAAGCTVLLITNAPRPHGPVERQLAALGVPCEAWDKLITSGDVTRALIAEGPRRVFHIGPEMDLPLFDGLDVELVEEFEAAGVVCSGLEDDRSETPDDYAELLARLRARDLPMICANPDIVVERGDRLIWCAGALARDYGLLGGRTMIAGKPHRPIYEAALREAEALIGRPVAASEVLAIGDGILTDIKGAVNAGIDALFVTAGIHAREYGDGAEPEPERLAAFLAGHGFMPAAVIPRLA
ncbi:TIGR01459 family HAD-type hydrolase [Aquibium sp. A9E412]|uniref:TIGR01459 family HAD-type hydrolase n=1 Tax=Aquibium sp. A9E412 TaxID=2976767 RepID=UPI0025B0D9C9|nr:TIGR01459 family HAD-type hydrolase [Aquibium sp. A9E412]MDN2566258.1 TIGR01459 family HAD-type hydrolase [Aquibium sp. A9E412]